MCLQVPPTPVEKVFKYHQLAPGATSHAGHVTFGYRIEPITATAGADYTGTTVMAGGTNFAFVAIPVIMDGVAEPLETLRVRLTSSSIGGVISDGIGTILNDGQIPADCTLTRPSLKVTSLDGDPYFSLQR